MESTPEKMRQQRLMQIIIGSAWVDGTLEARESEYLTTLLRRYGLEKNEELQRSLTTPIPIQQTEQWMRDYLFGSTEVERQRLLVAIAKLMIIDEVVSDIEHQLLDDYYQLMAEVPPIPDLTPMVQSLGNFVKKTATAIGQFMTDVERALE